MTPLIKSTTSNTAFTPELVREQLVRLQKSEMLRSSGVLLRFLEFIINLVLEGRAFEIKEYTIGVEVFNRPSSFSPQNDAIVRINAGRLRRILRHYYEGPGQNDAVHILIPKGSYVPTFEPLQKIEVEEGSPLSQRLHGLTIAVLPFHGAGPDDSLNYFTDGLGEHLGTMLARFKEFSVVCYHSSRRYLKKESDYRAIGKFLEAHYILTGSVRFSADLLRVNVQLVFTEDASQVWTDVFEYSYTKTNLIDIEDKIVKRLLSRLGGFNGIIIGHIAQIPKALRIKILGQYDSLYWFHFYKNLYTTDALFQARCAVEESLRVYPENALALAVYSELYSDSIVLQVPWVDNALETAQYYADKSILLDPACQQGFLARAFCNLLMGNVEECIAAAEHCVNLDRSSSGHLGLAGAYLVCAAKYEQGMSFMTTALDLNPYYLWCVNVGLSLCYFKTNRHVEAQKKAKLIHNTSIMLGPILQAATLGKLKDDEAKSVGKKLLKTNPDIRKTARGILSGIICDDALVVDILDGLHLAGVELPFKSLVEMDAK